jgi:DNA-binding FadR family transcriptional regulator
MDLQIAIEGAAITLAASKRSQADLDKLSNLLEEAEGLLDDPAAFTQSGQKFHLAIMEASGNRVFISQFKALRYVVWSKNAKRANREIALHALKIHTNIYHVIKDADPESARKLMTAHLESIRAMTFPKNIEKAINGPVCC